MFDRLSQKSATDIVAMVVVIAIILGALTSFFFLLIDKESYSAIYIIPDSIVYDKANSSVWYTYGVSSSESGTTDYTLNVYRDNTLVKTKQFSLRPGEVLDERDRVTLPPIVTYPSKISLNLTTKTSTNEVHFWLPE